jgi:hypothetical protein
MKRLWIILLAAAAIELSRGYRTPTLQAILQAPAVWTRVTQTALDPIPHEWPETSHAQKAWRATYAWGAIQRWRPGPGVAAFSKGRYSAWPCRKAPIRPR